jgi:MYXO-CTERM domain-containing protein
VESVAGACIATNPRQGLKGNIMTKGTFVQLSAASAALLGALNVAEAGVVAVPIYLNTVNINMADDGLNGYDTSGVAMNGPTLFSNPTYGSALVTQFLPTGFEMTLNSTAAANNQGFVIVQYFNVTDAVNYSLLGGAANGANRVQIRRITGTHHGVPTGPAVFDTDYISTGFDFSGVLNVGNYYLQFEFNRNGATNATIFDLDFTPVPAPGALALLGLAGLAGGRRRRA